MDKNITKYRGVFMKKIIGLLSCALLGLGAINLNTVHATIDPSTFSVEPFLQINSQVDAVDVVEYEVLDGSHVKLTTTDNPEMEEYYLVSVEAPSVKKDAPNKMLGEMSKKYLELLLDSADSTKVQMANDIQSEDIKEQGKPMYLWVDGFLVQEILVTEGYVRINNVTEANQYYLTELETSEVYAMEQGHQIWKHEKVYNTELVRLVASDKGQQAMNQYPEISSIISNLSDNSKKIANPSRQQKAQKNLQNAISNQNQGSSNTQNFVQPVEETQYTAQQFYEEPAYVKPQTEAAANVYYPNCSAARSVGAAPVYAGQPGYGSHLDRDGDGVGCE